MNNRRLRIYAIDRPSLYSFCGRKDIDDITQQEYHTDSDLCRYLENHKNIGLRFCPYDKEKTPGWTIIAYQYNILYHSIDVLVQSDSFDIIPELQPIPRYNTTR